ncbi:ATP-binding protein [Peredibacter sp. HCB2-198]|uniref:sensor histidine kinase n=1 Tax=Peredibacter sp. HCB2-198 TaxID=3383025 RepID=UPI0038B484CA
MISLISLYTLVRISDVAVGDYRLGYLLYIGRSIEKSNNYRPVSKINVNKVKDPPLPQGDTLNLLKLTEFGPDLGESATTNEKRTRPLLWLASQEGIILSSNTDAPLPIDWRDLKLPKKIHGMESNESNILEPKTFVVKLNTTPTTYLISHNERTLFQGPYLLIQGTHTFTTAALAVFLALSISFYYLRRKSNEARKVLARLEAGDLKARFEINRYDEFGNLILDFNRMADEIEKLVKRVQDTEVSRTNLLQELGHDLRTPMTSLTTAFETLKLHHDQLSSEDCQEIFAMITTDIRYFKELLDKLTLVATIDGPHYKASTETIDLNSLLQTELYSRQIAAGHVLSWKFVQNDSVTPYILGDSHLITRLFRNAFDNASRYAASNITVKINVQKEKVEVLVMDDGPGLTAESLQSFGKRRERRQRKEKDPNDFSLGLGSVIMKTITQVHGGTIEMMNLISQEEIQGACLKVTFQKAQA